MYISCLPADADLDAAIAASGNFVQCSGNDVQELHRVNQGSDAPSCRTMEVVAPHHSLINTVNSPRYMHPLKSKIPDSLNSNVSGQKDAALKDKIQRISLRDESKVENVKVPPESQDDEDIIANSDTVQSTLSGNLCESPAIQSGKPSEKDRKQMDFLLKGLPILGKAFELHHKIGEGTFSSVFLATLRRTCSSPFINKQFAIKHLVPTTHPSRAERELRCLREIGGKDNVVGVHVCLRNADFIAFVMPYLPHRRFSEYVLDMGVQETRLYMRNLLLALSRVHAFNIIHRDVKPSNFLYNRETKQFLLVDFGLSQPVEETAPPKNTSPDSSNLDRKRKRCDDVEVNTSASRTDSNLDNGSSTKLGSQCAVTENAVKRRALQPCNHNTLNIMKTPEKGPRYQTENTCKFAPSMSSLRARNLHNITNTNMNGNVQKAALNLKHILKSPSKEATETAATRKTPRKTKNFPGDNFKSPTNPFNFIHPNKCSFGVPEIWKYNYDENRSRSRFAAGLSKIKADFDARRNGLKEPLQRRILFDDRPDPKPGESKLFAQSRSASILRRSLNADANSEREKGTVPSSPIFKTVMSPNGPWSAVSANRSESNGREFRTLVPDGAKDTSPGSSIVRVQNSQVKSQQRSPVTPSESRKLLLQTSREKEQQKVVFAKPHAPFPLTHCACFGKAQVCAHCLVRKPQGAPRAGTPGFRPPEVLLRSPVQTTAVDMWAAGVILLCILSGCYPFFRSPDDLTALAEIMTVFGTQSIKEIAERLGRLVVCSQASQALDLKKLCIRMRQRRKDRGCKEEGDKCINCCQAIRPDTGCICQTNETSPLTVPPEDVSIGDKANVFPDTAYHLLARLLDLNPETRITAADALTHPFVSIV